MSFATNQDPASLTRRRQALMQLCAAATGEELRTGLDVLGALPAHRTVRMPEIGLVMLRGRTGGDGAPFNLGEATVTRATIRLESGETGFACLLGRAPEKAEMAALMDALMQRPEFDAPIEDALLPLRERLAQEVSEKTGRTAATRVNFFTLVRGEDA